MMWCVLPSPLVHEIHGESIMDIKVPCDRHSNIDVHMRMSINIGSSQTDIYNNLLTDLVDPKQGNSFMTCCTRGRSSVIHCLRFT